MEVDHAVTGAPPDRLPHDTGTRWARDTDPRCAPVREESVTLGIYCRCRRPQPGQVHANVLGGATRCISDPHLHRRVLYGVGSICTVDEAIATC